MKLFLMDTDGEGMGVDLAVRAQNAGHTVRYWLPTENSGERNPYGQGLVERPDDWKESMDWGDLIVLTGNSVYSPQLATYFGKGYPIFGTNQKAAELELDRGVGQQVLAYHDIEVLPYTVVDSVDEAVAHLLAEDRPFVLKPWGGDADKSMTAVPRSVDEGLFILEKWQREGTFKGQLMMQEKIEGVEMGISGWFGPGGWLGAIEESWEHKKFLNDDLGENTGEMGTVIRHVKTSKLFDLLLAPLTDYLHAAKFTGDCSINCIIDPAGTAWPLEFTMRLGWPDFCIRQAVIRGDPIAWMYDLLHGRDSLKVSPDIAVGVLLAHGDFPKSKDNANVWSGCPITGAGDGISWQQAMYGQAICAVEGACQAKDMMLTAGTYVAIAAGTGETVKEAAKEAYKVAWKVKWPGNIMFRTDIGKRLKKDLPLLQKYDYALGMAY